MNSSTASPRRAPLLVAGLAVVVVALVLWSVRPGDVADPQNDVPPTPSAPTSVPTGPTEPTQPPVLWTADHEAGDLDEWSQAGGGGLFNSGTHLAASSTAAAQSGRYSLRARIWTPGTAGVRAVRWKETREQRDLHFSVWIHVPDGHRITGTFVNVLQFKSRSTTGRNDPLWGLYGVDDGSGGIRLRAGWGWGGTEVSGPSATDSVGGKWIESLADTTLPTGRWVHLEAFLHQSKDHDGRVRFWMDGVELYDFMNVRTTYPNCAYNDWCGSNEWSVNLYSDGLAPSPATMYIDEAAISIPTR